MEFDAIYKFALACLSKRMLSVSSLRKVLNGKTADRSVVESVIEDLLRQGYVDDNKYAACYIFDSVNLYCKGAIRIRRELVDKGVALDIIESELKRAKECGDIDFSKALSVLLRCKLCYKSPTNRADLIKLKNIFLRRGFSLAEVDACLKDVSDGFH